MMVECTISLGNFENIKVSAEGKTKEETINQINDVLDSLGNTDKSTKTLIESYQHRVLNKVYINPNAPCKDCEVVSQKTCENLCIDNTQFHCEACGEIITKAQKETSMRWLGKPLCRTCERKPKC